MSSERLQEGRIRLDRKARHFEDDLELPHKTRSLDHGLQHAPATSHGTYVGGLNEDLEDLEFYQLGGYHPIHLGDELGPPGRYRVIHKLGHGGFGTVWLCRDSQASRYVAVKVMTADLSSDLILDLSLLELDQAIPGADYIALPLDRFSLTGPNGTHQCIALPVLGARVSPGFWHSMDMDPGAILRKMCLQATQALNFLHQNGICHGGGAIHLTGSYRGLRFF